VTRAARLAVLLALVVASAGGCSASSPGASSSSAGRHLSFPSCVTSTAPTPPLSGARTEFGSVPGDPFGVAATTDGRWSFVALGTSVGVFSDAAFLPKLVRTIPTPGTSSGVALTPDGNYLLVADGGSGAIVLDVARAEQGTAGAIVATLSSPGGDGAVEVAVSADGRFAFVTLEKSEGVAVFDLAMAVARRGAGRVFVGKIPLREAPVGMALSPDGRWFYATSEGGAGRDGLVYVIDVERAETTPGRAVVSSVAAGCSPVRVIASTDGATVWVAARGSNELLAFSSDGLRRHPATALLAKVEVGFAPVGLALVDGGRYVVVADSNRFGTPNGRGDLRILDTTALLSGQAATATHVLAGGFPREMAVVANGAILLVTNYTSGQIEAVDVTGLS
jgi:DNA-binding beta-propeller fold protein YncE